MSERGDCTGNMRRMGKGVHLEGGGCLSEAVMGRRVREGIRMQCTEIQANLCCHISLEKILFHVKATALPPSLSHSRVLSTVICSNSEADHKKRQDSCSQRVCG